MICKTIIYNNFMRQKVTTIKLEISMFRSRNISIHIHYSSCHAKSAIDRDIL